MCWENYPEVSVTSTSALKIVRKWYIIYLSICFTYPHLVPSGQFLLLHLEFQRFKFTLHCYCNRLRMTCVVMIVTVAAEKQRVAEEVANMLAVSIEVDTNFTQTYDAIHVKQFWTSVIYWIYNCPLNNLSVELIFIQGESMLYSFATHR